jgi:hypothetical protein
MTSLFDTETKTTLNDYINDKQDNRTIEYHRHFILSTVANITNGDLYAVKQTKQNRVVINTFNRNGLNVTQEERASETTG